MYSKIFIPSKYNADEIKKILEDKFKTPISIDSVDKKVVLSFQSKRSSQVKKITVMSNFEFSGFNGTMVKLPQDSESSEICTTITHVTGGFFNPHSELSSWMLHKGKND